MKEAIIFREMLTFLARGLYIMIDQPRFDSVREDRYYVFKMMYIKDDKIYSVTGADRVLEFAWERLKAEFAEAVATGKIPK